MGLDDLKNYVVGVILFVVVITGGIFMLGSFYDSDSSLDSTGQIHAFNNSFAKASEVTSSVNAMNSSLNVDEKDAGFLGLGWINALIGSAFNGLKAVYGSLSFMTVVGSEASGMFGIPYSIVALIVLIITVIVVFAIWAAITRV